MSIVGERGVGMLQPQYKLPDLPEIGYPETYYARQVHRAEKQQDSHAREAFKVAQYITLAMDPHLTWEQKLRYFLHALHRHCNPPPLPGEQIWLFYRQLAHLVRDYAGREALRLASEMDDAYARRVGVGVSRDEIREDATLFFGELMGANPDRCPEHFHDEDWDQLKLLRTQWV